MALSTHLSPNDHDVMIYRLEREGGVRWLVRHGEIQFESSDEHRAHRQASEIARTENVRCLLSDEKGVRPLDLTTNR